MIKEMLYTIALNEKDELTQINDAKKGEQYHCPSCKNKLTLKKSGNTGKGSKRPHFAHENTSPNCTPEGVLHLTFKKGLVDLLDKLIKNHKGLIIDWHCEKCSMNYSKLPIKWNLLQHIHSVEEEFNLKVCRPDIALLDDQRNVLGVVEIVVTHEPEENTINYLRENGITLIQINLSSEEDINMIEEKINNPNIVNYCINPKCSNLNNHNSKRRTEVFKLVCPSCRQIAYNYKLVSGSVFGTINMNFLNDSELEYIKSNNVHFKMKKDPKTGISYPFTICPVCEGRQRAYRNQFKQDKRL